VISCHDLRALGYGYLAALFTSKKKRPLLVYDSHEFELGRNTGVPRTRFQTWAIKQQERFLIRRSALCIIPADSAADEVQRIHKLKARPVVVRSTPNNWILDPSVCEKRRQEFIQMMNAGGPPFFVMYHGGVLKNRGVEMFIKLVSLNPNIIGIILGYALDGDYMDALKRLVIESKADDRILFLPTVPLRHLWEYVGAVDVGVILVQNTCRSYYMCLPNKFFENVQSLTPIVTSDFPEMRRLIEKYEIGLVCDQTDVESVNACIEKMRTDKTFYARCKENLKQAKEDLCWENEKNKLIEAYVALAAKHRAVEK